MKIISSIREDGWHKLGDASYEWWYFDAIDPNGYGIVITFFYGLPFSPYYSQAITEQVKGNAKADPGQHCAFYLSLYGPRRTECYVLNEYTRNHFRAREDRPEVAIDRCTLSYDSARGYIIDIDATSLFRRQITGQLIFQPLVDFNINLGDANEDHVWNCVAPRCQVTGQLKISSIFGIQEVKFQGSGYHDHNYGTRPMNVDMVRWHWGRLHAPQHTSIYYTIEPRQGERQSVLAVLDQKGQLQYCGAAEYQAEESRHFMGVRYFPRIELKTGDEKIRLSVANHRVVDKGPFYLRFLADQELKMNGDSGHRSIGFAEAFEPEKLFVKAFWPFVRMKIRKY